MDMGRASSGVRWGVATLALVAACSHQAAATGMVSGVVRTYGGPAVVVDGKVTMAMNGVATAGQTVTASRGGRSVATTTTDKNGRFSLALSPGDYIVTACAPGVNAAVRAEQTTSVELTCAVP